MPPAPAAARAWSRIVELASSRWELLRMLALASPGLVVGTVAVMLIAGLLPVGLILAGGVLSGEIADSLGSNELAPVIPSFLLVMGLFLVAEILGPVQGRLRWRVSKAVDGAIRERVVRAALSGADVTHLQGTAHLEAMGELQGLVRWAATPGQGAAAVVGLARDYLTVFVAAAVLAAYQPVVALAVLIVTLVMRVRWRRATFRIVEVWREGDRARREGWYLSELGLGRAAQLEVRLFDLRHWLNARVGAAGVAAWTPTWRQRRAGMGRNGVWHVALTGAATLFGLAWMAAAIDSGALDVAELVVFVPMMFLLVSYAASSPDDMAVEYGVKVLPAIDQVERDALRARDGHTGRSVDGSVPPSIEMSGVSFSYPGGADVLTGVDVSIPSGTSLAVVGLNGAGKTTLVRLLCGLHQPSSGRIEVNGIDLANVSLSSWHRLIAPIFQGFLRMPGTVADNVAVGAVGAVGAVQQESADLGPALDAAEAAGFTSNLSEGLATPLATPHVDGSDLSGGQWQRLAHARAAFAVQHGARLLLLDEPTSNLDTATEEGLVRRLVEETAGSATTVLVTHRLALARRCDRIVVLAEGRVVEYGTHDELVASGGRYGDAFGLQAGMYPWGDDDG